MLFLPHTDMFYMELYIWTITSLHDLPWPQMDSVHCQESPAPVSLQPSFLLMVSSLARARLITEADKLSTVL